MDLHVHVARVFEIALDLFLGVGTAEAAEEGLVQAP
jgi:hypothetical protein